ncbi:MAG: hypothetical protein A2V98_23145 [Planctomycetes bacterium RBG_16_64_12]|nr:MAG: hypothetical protein A2V98_23145 [Planctomycetes bacterium RBG_16_64_12]
MELGVGLGQRAVRMIEVAASCSPVREIHYTGVDLFEARAASDGPGMTLKTAHRLLKTTGARIQLLPGDPFTALSRAANGLRGTELLVISEGHDPRSLSRAWFYLPRMLDKGAQVWLEQAEGPDGSLAVRVLGGDQIAELAAAATYRPAA